MQLIRIFFSLLYANRYGNIFLRMQHFNVRIVFHDLYVGLAFGVIFPLQEYIYILIGNVSLMVSDRQIVE